jgi:hypothetical protein
MLNWHRGILSGTGWFKILSGHTRKVIRKARVPKTGAAVERQISVIFLLQAEER